MVQPAPPEGGSSRPASPAIPVICSLLFFWRRRSAATAASVDGAGGPGPHASRAPPPPSAPPRAPVRLGSAAARVQIPRPPPTPPAPPHPVLAAPSTGPPASQGTRRGPSETSGRPSPGPLYELLGIAAAAEEIRPPPPTPRVVRELVPPPPRIVGEIPASPPRIVSVFEGGERRARHPGPSDATAPARATPPAGAGVPTISLDNVRVMELPKPPERPHFIQPPPPESWFRQIEARGAGAAPQAGPGEPRRAAAGGPPLPGGAERIMPAPGPGADVDPTLPYNPWEERRRR